MRLMKNMAKQNDQGVETGKEDVTESIVEAEARVVKEKEVDPKIKHKDGIDLVQETDLALDTVIITMKTKSILDGAVIDLGPDSGIKRVMIVDAAVIQSSIDLVLDIDIKMKKIVTGDIALVLVTDQRSMRDPTAVIEAHLGPDLLTNVTIMIVPMMIDIEISSLPFL